jgi:hypothetical protein
MQSPKPLLLCRLVVLAAGIALGSLVTWWVHARSSHPSQPPYWCLGPPWPQANDESGELTFSDRDGDGLHDRGSIGRRCLDGTGVTPHWVGRPPPASTIVCQQSSGSPSPLAFSQDGGLLAVGWWKPGYPGSGGLELREGRSGRLRGHLAENGGVYCARFLRDGKTLAFGQSAVHGACDRPSAYRDQLELLDYGAMCLPRNAWIPVADHSYSDIQSISPDGQTVVFVARKDGKGTGIRDTFVWHPSIGDTPSMLPSISGFAPMRSVFSPDGHRFAELRPGWHGGVMTKFEYLLFDAHTWDVLLWCSDLQTGEERGNEAALRCAAGRIRQSDMVNDVAFSWDGSRLAVVGDRIAVRDTERGCLLFEINSPAFTAAFSPDGAWLALGIVQSQHGADENAIVVMPSLVAMCDLPRRRIVYGWRAHDDLIREMCFSPDGRILATASDDGTVKLWQVGSILDRENRH